MEKMESKKKVSSGKVDHIVAKLKEGINTRLHWLDQYSNIGADRGILSNLNQLDESNNSVNVTVTEADDEYASSQIDR